MASHAFTKNYRDHSNDTGFQFEFFCDKCGSGHRSSYKTNTVGFLGSMVKAATSILGSGSQLGTGADQLKDALRGPAWDGAFTEAVAEIRPRFHQCTRCGQWVCPDVCWNDTRQLCESCAPDLQEAAGAIQAEVAIAQARTKAAEHDQTGGLDLGAAQQAACPKCRARLEPNARFCASCGHGLAGGTKTFCSQCGQAVAAGARFCAGCGAKQ
jgi:hypothetical protein